MAQYLEKAKDDLVNDVTWNKVEHLTRKGARKLPRASAEYVVDKFPITGWLPRYNYRWLINDVIAGLTLGLMLIPQGLSYASLATIPVQYGLMSSWLPSAIYAFMGTSKDLSTGPTSLCGLLTSEIIEQLHDEPYTPSQIASAAAMMMGIYGMILGFLKLGFLLEFISLPILSGFITAVAITIILNQMPHLLGETDVGDGTAQQIHDIFAKLPEANGYACAVGFTAIFLLTVLDQAGKRWGKKNKIVWFLSITRAFIALLIYTGVGYAVNRYRAKDDFLFAVAKVQGNGQEPPKVPSGDLLSKVAGRSIALFIGSAVEHTAIARAFGVRNNYVTDQSQELSYYGVTNFFNAFFHSMGVGGAMSRTAVNSACNVKSPLSGLVTTAVVLISIFYLVNTLYWIPKATLAAIIITAVWPLISSPSTFYKYWKTSLADFISSMIALWVSLFVSTEIGIGAAVGFNIVYVLLRQVFVRVSSTSSADPRSELPLTLADAHLEHVPSTLPADVRIFRFNESVFFPNAYRVKTAVLDVIQTHHAPIFTSAAAIEAERNWSVTGERRIRKLRRHAGITDASALPPINVVILDFIRVNHLDATAVTHFRNLVTEVRKYAGQAVDVRFVGLSSYVRARFERAGWRIVDGDEPMPGGMDEEKEVTRLYPDIPSAVRAPRGRRARNSSAGGGSGAGSDQESGEITEEKKAIDGAGRGARTSHREEV